MFRIVAVTLVVATAVTAPLPARAQPIPPEFQVNLTIVGDQTRPYAASNAAGDWVVGFMSEGTMMLRSFGSIQGEYVLPVDDGPNTLTDVALGPNAVGVTFDRIYLGGVSTGAVARFYTTFGLPTSPEIPLLAPGAAIAATDDGFVILFRMDAGQPGMPFTDLYAQRYLTDGSTVGSPFLVGAERWEEGAVSAAALPDGRFVAAWAPNDLGDNYGIYVRAFAADDTPSGPAVLAGTPPMEAKPEVGIDGTGAFAVVWREGGPNSETATTMARRYDPAASPLGDAFRVDDEMQAYYGQHAMSLGADGVLTVAWVVSELVNNYHDPQVYARHYASNGDALGPSFRVNVRTQGIQWFPGVVTLPTDEVVIVWEGHDQDGSGSGIFGRYFGGPTPAKTTTFGGLKALFERN